MHLNCRILFQWYLIWWPLTIIFHMKVEYELILLCDFSFDGDMCNKTTNLSPSLHKPNSTIILAVAVAVLAMVIAVLVLAYFVWRQRTKPKSAYVVLLFICYDYYLNILITMVYTIFTLAVCHNSYFFCTISIYSTKSSRCSSQRTETWDCSSK